MMDARLVFSVIPLLFVVFAGPGGLAGVSRAARGWAGGREQRGATGWAAIALERERKCKVEDRHSPSRLVHAGGHGRAGVADHGRRSMAMTFFAICVDAETGAIRFNQKLFHADNPEPLGNNVNCYASPSPAMEPGRVYVHFRQLRHRPASTPPRARHSGSAVTCRAGIFAGPARRVILF